LAEVTAFSFTYAAVAAGDDMPLYSFASALLNIAFLVTVLTGLFILLQLFLGDRRGFAVTKADTVPRSTRLADPVTLSAWAVIAIALLTTLASAILLYAFAVHDFIVEYVALYSDRTLPLFYRLTAFWAGQAGSLLFWAWSVGISGALFVLLPAFRQLGTQTKLGFCLFFLGIMGFFLLLLSIWSNPFTTLSFTPQDGRGLNPLLQSVGMLFHPPILFLGYGGFVVPGCLALAQALSGNLFGQRGEEPAEESWEQASRPFILSAWALLSAGIIIGAWWAYMELGWGGYWAWDPVENASLIPWLLATAYLHTAVIGSRRGKLQRTNVFLMIATTISTFFATYLVRSGVVQSLHAFGSGTVSAPLVIFILATLYLALVISLCAPGPDQKQPPRAAARALHGLVLACFAAILGYVLLAEGVPVLLIATFVLLLTLTPFLYPSPNPDAEPLEDISSKEGLLLLVAWLLLALTFIILVATMWPVIIDSLKTHARFLPGFIAARLPNHPSGLDINFYNTTCLPLFTLLAVLLLICPFRKWKLSPGSSGFSHPRLPAVAMLTALILGVGLWRAGITHPVALVAAACSVAGVLGIVALFASNTQLFSVRSTLAAHGTHISVLLMVLGIAFSGPYQEQHTLQLERGQTLPAGSYQIRLNQLYEGESRINADGIPNFRFVEVELIVLNQSGKPLGVLAPQRRLYANFEEQNYAHIDTLFSLGKEVYALLLGIDANARATVAININPLVNWLWIGGTLLCLFPFFGLKRVRRMKTDA